MLTQLRKLGVQSHLRRGRTISQRQHIGRCHMKHARPFIEFLKDSRATSVTWIGVEAVIEATSDARHSSTVLSSDTSGRLSRFNTSKRDRVPPRPNNQQERPRRVISTRSDAHKHTKNRHGKTPARLLVVVRASSSSTMASCAFSAGVTTNCRAGGAAACLHLDPQARGSWRRR